VFGFDVVRKDIRTYVLSRLGTPALTGRKFAVAKKFDLEEYLRGSLRHPDPNAQMNSAVELG
jgi:hypothetical protein